MQPSLWRNRDFTLLWGGQALSAFGSRVSAVAYPLLTLALTHSPVKAGLVGTVWAVAGLIGDLLGGIWIDTHDRRVVVVVSDGAQALAMAAVGVTTLTHTAGLGVLLVTAGCAGLFSGPSDSALGASLVRVVPDEQLEQAIALQQARSEGASIAGNGAGGLLFGLAQAVPFLTDAVTFVISLLSVLGIRTSLMPERGADHGEPLRRRLLAGVHWLLGRPVMMGVCGSATFLNFSYNATLLTVVVLSKRGGASSFQVGVALALGSAGGILGAIAAARVVDRLGPLRSVLLASWTRVITIALLALTENYLVLGLLLAVAAALSPAANVVLGAKLRREIPDELRGRVSSVLELLLSGAGALGPVVAGALLVALGRGTPLVLAVIAIPTAALFTLAGPLRAFTSERPTATA